MIDLARAGHRLAGPLLGDLVEDDAVDRLGRRAPVACIEVPGDGLALAVRVGRQVDLARRLDALLELLDELGLVARHDVLRGEVVVDVDAQRALGQVADVAHARP